MRSASKYLFLLGLIATSSVAAKDAQYNNYIDGLYRAPSLDGMTGLLTMNLPHTMGAGITLIGGGTFSGSGSGVYDSAAEAVAAVRIGFGNNVEIGLKGKSYRIDPVVGTTQTGLGDSEASIKWKFREQNDNLPAMALALGVILPTGDNSKGFNEVESLGIKFGVTAAAEKAVYDDGYIGLYFEAQAIAIDTLKTSSPYKEMYGKFNVGLAFPISEDNHLSFFTEFNQVVSKDVATTVSGNYVAVTPGLRYAHENFSLTVAGQNVNYENAATTENRIIGLLSLGF